MKWEIENKKLENSYFRITSLVWLVLPPYGGTNKKNPFQEPEQLPALERKRVYLIGQATIPCTPSLTPVDYGNVCGRSFLYVFLLGYGLIYPEVPY